MNAFETAVVVCIALLLTAFSYFVLGYPSESAPPQAAAYAKCPPWAHVLGDSRWTYWRIHYATGHRATGGWGKWHCTPRPEFTYEDAS